MSTARAWKATRDSLAGVFIDEDRAVVAGDNKHFLVADGRGITIKGPIALVSMSNEQRSGGLFVGSGDFAEMIPSTIVSPGPQKFPLPPISGITNLIADIAYFSVWGTV